ncbi:hypothetical protein FGO68_gene4788 [Halteria grandinella]|uniref:FACT complex subunit n=1 Tax=Halteria grandinella TaxID=5974 RepID=A0A8J8T7J2_HALGN|nr:hypothetical protein FGO68_gene4788 [Halteria grandinella]
MMEAHKDRKRHKAFTRGQCAINSQRLSSFLQEIRHLSLPQNLKVRISFIQLLFKEGYLDEMRVPAGYSGPQLEIIQRDPKADQKQDSQKFTDAAFGEGVKLKGPIGTFAQEQHNGSFAQEFKKFFEKQYPKVPFKDCSKLFDECVLVKDKSDLESYQIGSNFTLYAYSQLVEDVENDIEKNIGERQDLLAKKVEMIFDKKPKMKAFELSLPAQCRRNYDDSCLEFGHPVIIQSGGNYNLKIDAQTKNERLSQDTIILSVCAKYKDLCCSISRTLLINPVPEQKEAYELMLKIYSKWLEVLKPGSKISQAYSQVIDYVKKDLGKEESLKHLPKVYGYGIGLQKREDALALKVDNEKMIEAGHVFNLRISMANFDSRPNRTCLLIGDTVFITEEGNTVFTQGKRKDYADISYQIEENEEEEELPDDNIGEKSSAQKKQKPSKPAQSHQKESKRAQGNDLLEVITKGESVGVIQPSRLRNVQDFQIEDHVRKEQQEALFIKKQEQLRDRLHSGDLGISSGISQKQKDLSTVESYKSRKEIPKEARQHLIYIDKIKNSVLIPIKDQYGNPSLIPFHVLTIKNASTNTENNMTYLRINFHVPGGGVSKDLRFPAIYQPQTLWVKELTLKSPNSMSMAMALKQIRELLKKVKTDEQAKQRPGDAKEEDEHLANEPLIMSKTKKLILDNINIKPSLTGKKTVGALETHMNGFRFMSTKGQKIEITYKNIKHAVFQACKNDLVVLLHFRLKAPILVGPKKVLDIQFYTEVCALVDDLDQKARRRQNDMDELEQEERERLNKKRLNEKYHQFTKSAEVMIEEYGYNLVFDVPFKKFEFQGCHAKSSVNIMPASRCLLALQEQPFLVLDIDDIEVAHFERIQYGTRNFDLVLIYKEYQTFKRISAIPREHLDTIKSWLNGSDILYSEGPMCLNWTNILQHIREDFEGFVEDGGWSFLRDNHTEEDNTAGRAASGSENSDSDFNEDEDEEGDGSESDFSGSDEDAEGGSDAESSDVKPDSEEEEEGLSWDELDKQAAEYDSKRYQDTKMKNPTQGQGQGQYRAKPTLASSGAKMNGSRQLNTTFGKSKPSLMSSLQVKRR